MCAGLALHFLVTGIGGIASGAPLRWLLGCALPCTLLPLVVAPSGAANGVVTGAAGQRRPGWCVYARVARARAA